MDRPFRDALIMGFSKLGYFFLIVISFLSCESGDFNPYSLLPMVNLKEFLKLMAFSWLMLERLRSTQKGIF